MWTSTRTARPGWAPRRPPRSTGKDFNVTFNIPLDGGKLLIGDKVDITLAIEAVKA